MLRALVAMILLATVAYAQVPGDAAVPGDAGVPVAAPNDAARLDAGSLGGANAETDAAPSDAATAPDPGTPAHPEPAEQPRYWCAPFYAQPSILAGPSFGDDRKPGPVILRSAVGIRYCAEDVLEIHAGLVLDFSTDAFGSYGHSYGYLGWGGELQLTRAVTPQLAIGPRLALTWDKSVRTSSGELGAFWIGPRFEVPRVTLGLDLVVVRNRGDNYSAIPRNATGVYASVGLRGLAGSIAGPIAIVGLWVAMKIAAGYGS